MMMSENEARALGLRIVNRIGRKAYNGRNKTAIGPVASLAAGWGEPALRAERRAVIADADLSWSEQGAAIRALNRADRRGQIVAARRRRA